MPASQDPTCVQVPVTDPHTGHVIGHETVCDVPQDPSTQTAAEPTCQIIPTVDHNGNLSYEALCDATPSPESQGDYWNTHESTTLPIENSWWDSNAHIESPIDTSKVSWWSDNATIETPLNSYSGSPSDFKMPTYQQAASSDLWWNGSNTDIETPYNPLAGVTVSP